MKKMYYTLAFILFMALCTCHNLACGHADLPDLRIVKSEHSSTLLNHRIHQVDICIRNGNITSSQCVSKQVLDDVYSIVTQAENTSAFCKISLIVPDYTIKFDKSFIVYTNPVRAP